MNIQKENLDMVLENLIGKKAWGVALGHGSFLTLEFGKPRSAEPGVTTIHGEWHLWVYLCSWRLERDGIFMVGCEDNRTKIESVIREIEDSSLIGFKVSFPSLDAILEFNNGIILRLFSTVSEDNDGGSQHWMLFMPDDNILVAGPGSYLHIEKE